jgi:uncharacterized spore protein YtfJ
MMMFSNILAISIFSSTEEGSRCGYKLDPVTITLELLKNSGVPVRHVDMKLVNYNRVRTAIPRVGFFFQTRTKKTSKTATATANSNNSKTKDTQ